MFMEPIEIATAALEPAPRTRATMVKLAVGLAFLAVCTALLLPWTLLIGAWFAIATSVRAIGKIAREVRAMLLFSGETLLGR